MGERELTESVENLKGIGEKTAKLFNKCGVFTCRDLIYYFPRTYDEFKAPIRASELVEGEVCAVSLTIIGSIMKRRIRNLSIISFEGGDQTGRVKIDSLNDVYVPTSDNNNVYFYIHKLIKIFSNEYNLAEKIKQAFETLG